MQAAKQNFCQKFDPSKSGFGILNEKTTKIVILTSNKIFERDVDLQTLSSRSGKPGMIPATGRSGLRNVDGNLDPAANLNMVYYLVLILLAQPQANTTPYPVILLNLLPSRHRRAGRLIFVQ